MARRPRPALAVHSHSFTMVLWLPVVVFLGPGLRGGCHVMCVWCWSIRHEAGLHCVPYWDIPSSGGSSVVPHMCPRQLQPQRTRGGVLAVPCGPLPVGLHEPKFAVRAMCPRLSCCHHWVLVVRGVSRWHVRDQQSQELHADSRGEVYQHKVGSGGDFRTRTTPPCPAARLRVLYLCSPPGMLCTWRVACLCSLSGSYQPLLCVPGTFAAELGSTLCAPCPIGQYQSAEGSSMCVKCGAGYIPGPGSEDGLVGASQCVACGPGTFSAQGDSVCSPCPLGTVVLVCVVQRAPCICLSIRGIAFTPPTLAFPHPLCPFPLPYSQ